jgi:hypothetical protein
MYATVLILKYSIRGHLKILILFAKSTENNMFR